MTGEGAPPAPPDTGEYDGGEDRLRQLLLVELSEPIGARRRPSRPSSRLRRVAFPASLVVLLICGVALVGLGAEVVSNSTNGRLVTPVADPDSPGFEALVDPTPTMAVVTVDDDDLVGVAVLTLAPGEEDGGGVLIVPQRTVGDLPLFGENPLETSFEFGDAENLVDALGVVLDFGIPERAVVDDDRWAELVAPVAPIVLDNPNELYLDDERVFDVGVLELAPEDVGPYLRAGTGREGDLERLYRHELFFAAWLDAVADHGGVDAVPGEIDSGIGRFVRALAPGPVDVVTLPASENDSEEFGPDTYTVDLDRAGPLLQRLVPLPTSAEPGARARVRVLNGTSDLGQASRIAPRLPPAGVEIGVIGNAARPASATTVRYGSADFADEARRIAEILDVDEVELDPRASDSFDITVTLGPDA